MSKLFLIAFLLILVAGYLFLFLAIELDLKFVMEAPGIKAGQLIDSSSKIRRFASIQLAIFIIVSVTCIVLVLKKK